MQKVRKAIIPAAGLGTRFLPATKAMPKEIMPVVDTPSIQMVIEEALASGIEDILIVTGKGKQSIEDHFDANIALERNLEEKGKQKLLDLVQKTNIPHIHYVRQAYPRGLGDAILQAEAFVGNEPFAVLLGDDIMPHPKPLTRSLMETYDQTQSAVVATMRINPEDSRRYGIIDADGQVDAHVFRVNHLVEKPAADQAPSDLGIIGRYLLTPDIFAILKEQQPDEGNEIQLTDALETLNQEQPICIYEYTGKRFDVGDKYGLLVANIEFGLQHPETDAKMREHLISLAKELKK